MKGHVIYNYFAVNYAKSDKDHLVHFLTHIETGSRTDSVEGIISPTASTIYTSFINAAILRIYFKYEEANIVPVELGKTYHIHCKDGKSFIFTCMKSDYNCGSMILIARGEFGTVMYTGLSALDFNTMNTQIMRDIISQKSLTKLFIDWTEEVKDPKHIFSVTNIKKALIEFFTSKKNHFYIHVPVFGLEVILAYVAKILKERMVVDEKRMSLINDLNLTEFFTVDSSESRLHIISQGIMKRNNQNNSFELVYISALNVITSESCGYTHQGKLHYFTLYPHSSHKECAEIIINTKPEYVLKIGYSIRPDDAILINFKNYDRKKQLDAIGISKYDNLLNEKKKCTTKQVNDKFTFLGINESNSKTMSEKKRKKVHKNVHVNKRRKQTLNSDQLNQLQKELENTCDSNYLKSGPSLVIEDNSVVDLSELPGENAESKYDHQLSNKAKLSSEPLINKKSKSRRNIYDALVKKLEERETREITKSFFNLMESNLYTNLSRQNAGFDNQITQNCRKLIKKRKQIINEKVTSSVSTNSFPEITSVTSLSNYKLSSSVNITDDILPPNQIKDNKLDPKKHVTNEVIYDICNKSSETVPSQVPNLHTTISTSPPVNETSVISVIKDFEPSQNSGSPSSNKANVSTIADGIFNIVQQMLISSSQTQLELCGANVSSSPVTVEDTSESNSLQENHSVSDSVSSNTTDSSNAAVSSSTNPVKSPVYVIEDEDENDSEQNQNSNNATNNLNVQEEPRRNSLSFLVKKSIPSTVGSPKYQTQTSYQLSKDTNAIIKPLILNPTNSLLTNQKFKEVGNKLAIPSSRFVLPKNSSHLTVNIQQSVIKTKPKLITMDVEQFKNMFKNNYQNRDIVDKINISEDNSELKQTSLIKEINNHSRNNGHKVLDGANETVDSVSTVNSFLSSDKLDYIKGTVKLQDRVDKSETILSNEPKSCINPPSRLKVKSLAELLVDPSMAEKILNKPSKESSEFNSSEVQGNVTSLDPNSTYINHITDVEKSINCEEYIEKEPLVTSSTNVSNVIEEIPKNSESSNTLIRRRRRGKNSIWMKRIIKKRKYIWKKFKTSNKTTEESSSNIKFINDGDTVSNNFVDSSSCSSTLESTSRLDPQEEASTVAFMPIPNVDSNNRGVYEEANAVVRSLVRTQTERILLRKFCCTKELLVILDKIDSSNLLSKYCVAKNSHTPIVRDDHEIKEEIIQPCNSDLSVSDKSSLFEPNIRQLVSQNNDINNSKEFNCRQRYDSFENSIIMSRIRKIDNTLSTDTSISSGVRSNHHEQIEYKKMPLNLFTEKECVPEITSVISLSSESSNFYSGSSNSSLSTNQHSCKVSYKMEREKNPLFRINQQATNPTDDRTRTVAISKTNPVPERIKIGGAHKIKFISVPKKVTCVISNTRVEPSASSNSDRLENCVTPTIIENNSSKNLATKRFKIELSNLAKKLFDTYST